jgi:hypothetical protein
MLGCIERARRMAGLRQDQVGVAVVCACALVSGEAPAIRMPCLGSLVDPAVRVQA